MLDGVVEAHTAAMLEPYSDDPTQIGKLFWDPANYKQAVTELDSRGLQIFTHAIGDKAVRLALDAYQEAAETNHTHDARPRIEHIETISAQDIPRFGKLGVIASFQPLHAYPDEDTLDIWARNVGPERAQRAWAWHSIESTGGTLGIRQRLAGGDFESLAGSAECADPTDPEGDPPGGFVPSERISLEDAIKAYTLGAAFAGRREKTEGSHRARQAGGFDRLSQDLFKIEPNRSRKTEVLLTMVGGKVVYQSPAWLDAGADGGEMMIRRLCSGFYRDWRVLLLGSCGKKTPTLNLLVWEGYADPSFVHAFEEKYHCKVSASYMGSSDELVAKLRGGSAGNYDVISPSSDVATSIAAAGLAAAARSVADSQLRPAFAAAHFPAPGPHQGTGLWRALHVGAGSADL